MLIFAKDIRARDYAHPMEALDPGLKEYMEYQRSLFPYTIIRASLDLAYKELDDILNYVDNNYQAPAGSRRQEYPADIDAWFRERYPWASGFLNREAVHYLLVGMIQAMDSAHTHEPMNIFHWMTLYDVAHGAIRFYNDLLTFSQDRARGFRLSKEVPVDFDDFINNYWLDLSFMIMSMPDYPHARLLEKNRKIEDVIKERLVEGDDPLAALAEAARLHPLDAAAVSCLRRDPVTEEALRLPVAADSGDPYAPLQQVMPGTQAIGNITVLAAEYALNYKLFKDKKAAASRRGQNS